MMPWPYLHNMLLIVHAACTISDCFAGVVFLLYIQETFDGTEEVWKRTKLLDG